jgi:hypothetical protein
VEPALPSREPVRAAAERRRLRRIVVGFLVVGIIGGAVGIFQYVHIGEMSYAQSQQDTRWVWGVGGLFALAVSLSAVTWLVRSRARG